MLYLYTFCDKLYPTWWWPQQYWPKHVVDKLYTPDNIVVLWLLYPYRIITLGFLTNTARMTLLEGMIILCFIDTCPVSWNCNAIVYHNSNFIFFIVFQCLGLVGVSVTIPYGIAWNLLCMSGSGCVTCQTLCQCPQIWSESFFSLSPLQVTIYMLLNAFRFCETGTTVCTISSCAEIKSWRSHCWSSTELLKEWISWFIEEVGGYAAQVCNPENMTKHK